MGRGKDILSKLDEIIDRLAILERKDDEILDGLKETAKMCGRLAMSSKPEEVINKNFRNNEGLLDYQYYLSHKIRETEDES